MNYQQALTFMGISQADAKDTDKLDKKYQQLATKLHPDKGGTQADFEKLNQAVKSIKQGPQPVTQFTMQQPHQQQIWDINFNKFPNAVNLLFNRSQIPIVQPQIQTVNLTTSQLYSGINTPQFNIAPGAKNGQIIYVNQQFVIKVVEFNDVGMVRQGDDLLYRADVNLKQALMGGTLKIEHPSKKLLTINYRLKSPYEKIILKCKGMPIYGTSESFGNLIINFNVKFPTDIPEHILSDLDGVLSVLTYDEK